jgi:hypothetical protein
MRHSLLPSNAGTHSFRLSALGGFNVQHDLAILLFSTKDLGVDLELDVLLGENLLEVLAVADG